MVEFSVADLIATEDGSPSLFDAESQELFHNRAGAYTEALVHYCQPSGGCDLLARTGKLSLLDVCFGLGYNTFVLLEAILAEGLTGQVEVVAIERDPSVIALANQVLGCSQLSRARMALTELTAGWRTGRFKTRVVQATGELALDIHIICDDVRTIVPTLVGEKSGFDLIFHDPFSAKRMPELWTVDLFARYFELLTVNHVAGGRVLTYSTAAAVTAGLQLAGFTVTRTPELGGKRGGTLGLADSGGKRGGTIGLPDAKGKLGSRLGLADSGAVGGMSPAGFSTGVSVYSDGGTRTTSESLPRVCLPAGTRALLGDELKRLEGRAGVPFRDPGLALSRSEIVERRRQEQLQLPGS